jgi:outer membrane protein assembly factor BamD (BamD/ComL family)
MKRILLLSCILGLAGLGGSSAALAQSKVKTGPDQSTVRDPEIEKDSLHNLEVARQYFKLRKAYVASLERCEEIIAGDPNFSKIDEVLYLAGASSLKLANGQGKQASKLSPEKLRGDARSYLSKLINDYPQSSFRKSAEEDLKSLPPSPAGKMQ